MGEQHGQPGAQASITTILDGVSKLALAAVALFGWAAAS